MQPIASASQVSDPELAPTDRIPDELSFRFSRRHRRMSWRWYVDSAWTGIFISTAVLGGMLYSFSPSRALSVPPRLAILGLVALVPFLAFLYFCVAVLRNRTFVEVEDDTLVISSGPMPWGRTRRVPLGDLADLRVKKLGVVAGHHLRYGIYYTDQAGATRALLAHIYDEDVAHFIARELGDYAPS